MAIKVGDKVWIVANCPILCVCDKCKKSHTAGHEFAIYDKDGHIVERIDCDYATLKDHAKRRSLESLFKSKEEAQKYVEVMNAANKD